MLGNAFVVQQLQRAAVYPPEGPVSEQCKRRVARDKRQAFDLGLRRQHAVEPISQALATLTKTSLPGSAIACLAAALSRSSSVTHHRNA